MQELENQAVSQLLEHGLAKQDARSGSRELQTALDGVRAAEAAVEKLHRSLSRHKVLAGCAHHLAGILAHSSRAASCKLRSVMRAYGY